MEDPFGYMDPLTFSELAAYQMGIAAGRGRSLDEFESPNPSRAVVAEIVRARTYGGEIGKGKS